MWIWLGEGSSRDELEREERERRQQREPRNKLQQLSLTKRTVDALQLEVRISVVGTSGVNSMFVRDNFPELGTDLVTALTSLQMNDFTHV